MLSIIVLPLPWRAFFAVALGVGTLELARRAFLAAVSAGVFLFVHMLALRAVDALALA
jgi:hypothetical protein